MKMPPFRVSVLLSIVLLGLVVRLYGITNQPLDWHAFRQADTASVTREYVKAGSIDLLRPRYHDLSNIQSGEDNPEGYRMVEFPIINGMVAGLILLLPQLSLEITHRIVSILASLGSIVLVYAITRRISGFRVALFAAIMFAFLPFNIYYSRVILPEPMVVFLFLLGLWSFDRWLYQKNITMYLVSVVSIALSLLLKPFVAFFAPVFLAILWLQLTDKKIHSLTGVLIGLYAGIVVAPFFWWRMWISQFPEGIPDFEWLFNSDLIRLQPAWWRWLGYERLVVLMMGYLGSVFIAVSWLKLKREELVFYGSWAAGSLAYLIIIATGNVRHDYYQVLLMPIVCMLAGRGVVILHQLLTKHVLPILASVITIVTVLLTIALAWFQVAGYYNINNWEYIAAGEAVDRLTPADALVIAPAFGDTMFLYQTNRRGWPIGYHIEEKIGLGATHYVTTSYEDEARELEERYFTLEKTPEYLVIDLTRRIEE